MNYVPPEERNVIVEPGFTRSWSFSISGAAYVSATIEGDLLEYFALQDPSPNGPPRAVVLTLNVPPEDIPPGVYMTYIRVQEVVPGGGTVGGRAAVRAGITVTRYAEYPLLKLESFGVSAEEGAAAGGAITVKSHSTVPTRNARAKMTVFENGEPLPSLTGIPILIVDEVPSAQTVTKEFSLPTQQLTRGEYRVIADVTYDEAKEPLPAEATLKIGTFTMTLINGPEKLYRGKVNRVVFTLGNDWNKELRDVRVRVQIPALNINEGAFGDVSNIPPFGQQKFTFYLEPSEDAALGSYDGSIFVITDAKRADDKFGISFTTTVVEKPVETEPAPEQVIEEPLLALYSVAVVLVIINLFLLFRKKKE